MGDVRSNNQRSAGWWFLAVLLLFPGVYLIWIGRPEGTDNDVSIASDGESAVDSPMVAGPRRSESRTDPTSAATTSTAPTNQVSESHRFLVRDGDAPKRPGLDDVVVYTVARQRRCVAQDEQTVIDMTRDGGLCNVDRATVSHRLRRGATHVGFFRTGFAPVFLEIEKLPQVETIEIDLRRGRRVVVTCVDDVGNPLADVDGRVSESPIGFSKSPSDGPILPGPIEKVRIFHARSNAAGELVFEGLPPRALALAVAHATHEAIDRREKAPDFEIGPVMSERPLVWAGVFASAIDFQGGDRVVPESAWTHDKPPFAVADVVDDLLDRRELAFRESFPNAVAVFAVGGKNAPRPMEGRMSYIDAAGDRHVVDRPMIPVALLERPETIIVDPGTNDTTGEIVLSLATPLVGEEFSFNFACRLVDVKPPHYCGHVIAPGRARKPADKYGLDARPRFYDQFIEFRVAEVKPGETTPIELTTNRPMRVCRLKIEEPTIDLAPEIELRFRFPNGPSTLAWSTEKRPPIALPMDVPFDLTVTAPAAKSKPMRLTVPSSGAGTFEIPVTLDWID